MKTRDIIDVIEKNRAEEKQTRVILTKLEDKPDQIPLKDGIKRIVVNSVRTGLCMYPPEVGKSFSLVYGMSRFFRSSQIQKVNDDGTFETMNSIYKFELANE